MRNCKWVLMDQSSKSSLIFSLPILQAIVSDPSLAVVVTDTSGTILGWSLGAEGLYGYDDVEACGMNVTELMPPASRSGFRQFCAQLIESNPSVNSGDPVPETSRITRNGDHREVWSTATLVRNEAGDVQYLVLAEHDMTRDKQNSIRLNSYLDSSPDATIIIDRQGRIIRSNTEVEHLTGYGQQELLYENYEKLIPESIRAGHRDNHSNFFRNARSREMGSGLELHIRHKSGQQIPVQISLTPVSVANETTVLVRIRDIRQEVETRHYLARSRDEAEKADRAKSRFLAIASHDLRQPLHAINMYLGVLENQKSRDQRRNTINRVKTSIDSISQLLKGLLDISKLESGAIVPRISQFPIGDVLERVYNNAASAAVEKGQKISLVHSSAVVRSDQNLLEQLLANLASNAIRYTRDGGHIVIGCRLREERIEVQVLDNGMGIAEEYIDRIFEEYFRIGGSDRKAQGAGLGLAIVRQIGTLLNLELRVTSEVGRGTVFSVFLPRMRRQGRRRRKDQPIPEIRSDIAGATVLMLEDSAAVLDSTRMLLEEHGLEVLPALDFSKALAYLKVGASTPDLIISDYSLGDELNGLEAITRIRAELQRSIPAVLISGNTSSQLVHETKVANCRLAHKPVDPQLLMTTITGLLQE